MLTDSTMRAVLNPRAWFILKPESGVIAAPLLAPDFNHFAGDENPTARSPLRRPSNPKFLRCSKEHFTRIDAQTEGTKDAIAIEFPMKKKTMNRVLLLRAAMSLFALMGSLTVQGADSLAPLPPFYPESPAPRVYDPAKFIPKKDASIELASGRTCEGDFVKTLSLNGDWKFSGLEKAQVPFKDDADLTNGFEKPDFNDSKWDSITVPSNFYLKYKYDPKNPYVKGWYRKTIAIPAGVSGKRAILHFGLIGYKALLFVNGKYAGNHHGEFTPWDIDITDKLEAGKPIIIAIRVFSDHALKSDVRPKTITHPYGSGWGESNFKGGIWRSTELRFEPEIRVERAFINPVLEDSSVLVSVTIINSGMLTNSVDIHGAVIDAEAKSTSPSPTPSAKLLSLNVKPGKNSFDLKIALKNPKLWTPDTPNLYNLVLAFVENGKPISVKAERFGFRNFKPEGDHFLLNGKRIYLFGESIEVTSFENGNPDKDQPDANPKALKAAADVLIGFKSRGSNTLRLSEQPVSDAFLDLADETGMMIYDMWAWSFHSNLDPTFEQNDLEELAEWVNRDYNHPSVVMWLGGNEVTCTKEVASIFAKQASLIRSIDRSGRPVSAFSGSGSSGSAGNWAGTTKLDTDLLDLHCYIGLMMAPWTFWGSTFNSIYDHSLSVYAKDGKTLGMPYVVWEVVGFSWGQVYDGKYEPGDVDSYLKWAQRPVTINPNGMGWAGSIGLAAALDVKQGGRHGMEVIGRRIMDGVRQDTRICGFAPWFCKDSITLPSTSLWTQPVYCGLRDANGLPLRNIFGGKNYTQEFFVINSTNESYSGISAHVTMLEADGSERVLAEWNLPDLNAWQNATKDISLSIPAEKKSRWAQIRVRILAKSGSELSRNFYDVFIPNREQADAPIESKKTVGLLSCGASGTEHLKKILNALDVNFVEVSNPEVPRVAPENGYLKKILRALNIKFAEAPNSKDLTSCQVLIIPPSTTPLQGIDMGSPMLQPIINWVKKGGTLLVMEQDWNGEFPIIAKTITAIPSVFADIVVPSHPAFKGLSQANFEFWNNPAYGETGSYAFTPLSQDLIVAKGAMIGKPTTYGVLSDGKLGQGRIIASQFDACKLWNIDSAATVYLRNLLDSALSPAPGTIRPWGEIFSNFKISSKAEILPIDIKAQANMGFKDDLAGDNKGGWIDQGDNDFRMMPLGDQIFRDVRFRIVDPASNGGKSCIVLKDDPKGDFISSADGIKVGERFLRLFFLHSEACSGTTGETLKYRVNYADGQKLDIQTIEGVSICDWWNPRELSAAKLATSSTTLGNHPVGLCAMEWENPRPNVRIDSLDVVAPKGVKTVSMVVAISGERINSENISAGTGKWMRLADEGYGHILKEGVFIPNIEQTPADGPDAIRVTMPKHGQDDPTPVISTSFTNLNGPFHYLVMDLKGDSSGEIRFMLPNKDFGKLLQKYLSLSKNKAFHSLRIPLDDMPFTPENLRGEFYIFNSADTACTFQIRNLRLE